LKLQQETGTVINIIIEYAASVLVKNNFCAPPVLFVYKTKFCQKHLTSIISKF